MRKFLLYILCFILISISFANNQFPEIFFTGQIVPNQKYLKKLVGNHIYYVKGFKKNIPSSVVTNNYSKEVKFSCGPLYNMDFPYTKCYESLDNPRFIESIIAKGYCLNIYMWIKASNRPMNCVLIGYNSEKKYFIAKLKNGKEIKLAYAFVKYYSRFAQLPGAKNDLNWTFWIAKKSKQIKNNDQDQTESQNFIAKISVKTKTLKKAIKLLGNKLKAKKILLHNCRLMAYVSQNYHKNSSKKEKMISIPFTMEIKKKKLKSSGCGGFIWWPVGSKKWDKIYWDEEKYGIFLYLDPTKPVDYPDKRSKNYIHNRYWRCHPCGHTKMVPGVWVKYSFDGKMLNIRIIKHSTCNTGTSHWDQWGNPTGVVTGVINCWVEK